MDNFKYKQCIIIIKNRFLRKRHYPQGNLRLFTFNYNKIFYDNFSIIKGCKGKSKYYHDKQVSGNETWNILIFNEVLKNIRYE